MYLSNISGNISTIKKVWKERNSNKLKYWFLTMPEYTAKEFLRDSSLFLSIDRISTPNLKKELKIGRPGNNTGHLLPINSHLNISIKFNMPITARLTSTNLGSNISLASLCLRLLCQFITRVSATLSTHRLKESAKLTTWVRLDQHLSPPMPILFSKGSPSSKFTTSPTIRGLSTLPSLKILVIRLK